MDKDSVKTTPRQADIAMAVAAVVAPIIAQVMRDPDVLAAVRSALTPADVAPAGLVDAGALARELRVSRATVSRLTSDGMPHQLVGARRRYDVAACRAWLAERGPVAAPKRPKRAPDDSGVDISDVRGLRRFGGRP
jgi:hypothetical protein